MVSQSDSSGPTVVDLEQSPWLCWWLPALSGRSGSPGKAQVASAPKEEMMGVARVRSMHAPLTGHDNGLLEDGM